MERENTQQTLSKINSLLEKEFSAAVKLLADTDIPEMEYFLRLGEDCWNMESIAVKPPRFVIVGSTFPAAFLPIQPTVGVLWITGGSRTCTELSDEWLPRDTDPISRSVLGQLLLFEDILKESTLIVPLYNDSQKKMLTFLIERGFQVLTLDIPADKGSQEAVSAFSAELSVLQRDIAMRQKCLLFRSRIRKSCFSMQAAAEELAFFEEAARQRENVLSDISRLFIRNSFYLTGDIVTWQKKLKALRERIEVMPTAECKNAPRILIAGSSIFFPNYKLPELLASSGLTLAGIVDSTHGMFEAAIYTAQDWLARDCSASYIRNDTFLSAVRTCYAAQHCDGILWHVLKGQIEYDYELTRFEEMTKADSIPILRLETDYQYQDVEQLRIRVEAFGEMLRTRKRVQPSKASD